MRLRLLYFSLGIAVSVLACGFLLLWDSHQDYLAKKRALESIDQLSNPPLYTQPSDLVGRWHGRESYGTTFVILRRADGTYTKVSDSSRSDVPQKPPVTTENGYWTYSPPTYVEVAPSSRGAHPLAAKIKPSSATKFEYKTGEAEYVTETKEEAK